MNWKCERTIPQSTVQGSTHPTQLKSCIGHCILLAIVWSVYLFVGMFFPQLPCLWRTVVTLWIMADPSAKCTASILVRGEPCLPTATLHQINSLMVEAVNTFYASGDVETFTAGQVFGISRGWLRRERDRSRYLSWSVFDLGTLGS